MSESPRARLEHLQELVDVGLMTDEEYEASRRAIIDQTTGGGSARAQPAALGGSTMVGSDDALAGLRSTSSVADALAGGTRIIGPGAPGPIADREAGPEIPETLGNYRIINVIGAGGMGTVVRARHVEEGWAAEQGGDVAIKLIHPHISADTGFRSRFFTEAALGKRLQHPGLATVYDVVSEGPWLGTILEVVEGDELTSYVRPGGVDLDEVLRLLGPLADALDHLHAQGIIHRDLKPANVKVRPDGSPVLLDLGIAKDLKRNQDSGHRTQAMTAVGTSVWMAPEQADATNVTGAADRYALGLLAYALLSGSMPWPDGTTAMRALANKMIGQLTPLSDVRPGLPAVVYAAIQRALSVSPSERQESAAEFVRELRSEQSEPQQQHRLGWSEDLEARLALHAEAAAPHAPPPPAPPNVRNAPRAPSAPRASEELTGSLETTRRRGGDAGAQTDLHNPGWQMPATTPVGVRDADPAPVPSRATKRPVALAFLGGGLLMLLLGVGGVAGAVYWFSGSKRAEPNGQTSVGQSTSRLPVSEPARVKTGYQTNPSRRTGGTDPSPRLSGGSGQPGDEADQRSPQHDPALPNPTAAGGPTPRTDGVSADRTQAGSPDFMQSGGSGLPETQVTAGQDSPEADPAGTIPDDQELAIADCLPVDVAESRAATGNLDTAVRECIGRTVTNEDLKQTRRDRWSRVLIRDAKSRGDHQAYVEAIQYHLGSIDRSDANMMVVYGQTLLQSRDYAAAVLWAERALAEKQRVSSAHYVRLVDDAHRLLASASHELWKDAAARMVEDRTDARVVDERVRKGRAHEHARAWLDFRRAAGRDEGPPRILCESSASRTSLCAK